ncbi:hypothetical protein H2200_006064 [Cladophialophora chaetospira]|uniref:Heterokaryon incompatibility domain-containing protein n=1 Tax=Cladophialophora chaetospira TaxID=386627 RepID=A0AA39CIQ9_9EURO|nr:hypothetical protein H2200_006064 [Cladophialophora chaetospira]
MNQLVQFSLHHQNASNIVNDNFFSLSYACGDPQDTEVVLCNGKMMNIYKSLYKALQAVRLNDQQISIWADCICINQRDLAEKAKQVSNMWRIYRYAYCTLIWLGDSTSSTEVALRAMQKVTESTEELTGSNGQQLANINNRGPSRIDSPGPNLEETKPTNTKLNAAEFEAILGLLSLPYFTRSWIAQEVCLAKERRPPIVFHGAFKFSWALIINCWTSMIEYPALVTLAECSGKHPHDLNHMHSLILDLFLIMLPRRFARRPTPQGDIFRMTRLLETTEAVDKVYSLAALLTQGDDASQRNSPTLLGEWLENIDYMRTPESVFEELARILIEQDKNLSILSAAGSLQVPSPAHVSWVPHWSVGANVDVLHSGWYKAAGQTTPLHEPAVRVGQLGVGVLFHSVVATHDTRSLPKESRSRPSYISSNYGVENPLPNIMNLWECFVKKFKSYPTADTPIDAFWRTLICNRTEDNEVFLRDFRKLETNSSGSQPARHAPKSSKPTLNPSGAIDVDIPCKGQQSADFNIFNPNPTNQYDPSNDPLMAQIHDDTRYYGGLFVDTASYTLSNLRFFVTSTSHMGLGPPDMQIGDRVVILKGGPVPFVIRPRLEAADTMLSSPDEDREADVKMDHPTTQTAKDRRRPSMWTLVGPAYVHGMSEGKALESLENPDDDESWEHIILR